MSRPDRLEKAADRARLLRLAEDDLRWDLETHAKYFQVSGSELPLQVGRATSCCVQGARTPQAGYGWSRLIQVALQDLRHLPPERACVREPCEDDYREVGERELLAPPFDVQSAPRSLRSSESGFGRSALNPRNRKTGSPSRASVRPSSVSR
jgi:hypothetical protein